MAITITFYVGEGDVGKKRKAALKHESKRQKKSVSDVIWQALIKGPMPDLKTELTAIEQERFEKSNFYE